jgi:hypothetical protein
MNRYRAAHNFYFSVRFKVLTCPSGHGFKKLALVKAGVVAPAFTVYKIRRLLEYALTAGFIPCVTLSAAKHLTDGRLSICCIMYYQEELGFLE